MKKFITLIISITIFSLYTAQVAIGKNSVTNQSISLEFGTDNKGLILPWVTNSSAVSNAENGTLIYDTSDKKVKVKQTTGWKDFSVNTTGTTVDPTTNIDGMVSQNSFSENSAAKVSIGTPSSVSGILVLENTNQAMVLPKVASPHINIINPSAGMMVYDTVTKELAFYNGSVWTFWEPAK